jgi:spermidine/putrescine transport system permease protein
VVSSVLVAGGPGRPKPLELLYTTTPPICGPGHASLLFMVIPLVSSLESLDDEQPDRSGLRPSVAPPPTSRFVICIAAPGIAAAVTSWSSCRLHHHADLARRQELWFTEQIYTQFITRFQLEPGRRVWVLVAVFCRVRWCGQD